MAHIHVILRGKIKWDCNYTWEDKSFCVFILEMLQSYFDGCN